ncbi:hypothetical protein EC75_19476, partial [Escherichia coli 75]
KMLRKFITENDLKESYDYIFIDSPPNNLIIYRYRTPCF